ncbi:hypothetical protein BDZ89DRAFT_1077604, partial [Hymenopellis radicata]
GELMYLENVHKPRTRRDAGNGEGGRNDPRGLDAGLDVFLGVAATRVDTLMAWRTNSNCHSISPLLALKTETIERGDCRMQQIGGARGGTISNLQREL